jgi:hypothetical protein
MTPDKALWLPALVFLASVACSEAAPLDSSDDTDVLADPGRVVLNELLPGNSEGAEDDEGEREDWIELYNGRATAVSLTGWSLDDSELEPWVFPEGTRMDPGEHLVVWCDGDDGPLHASFKLSSDGETVGLYDDTTTLMDETSYSELEDDIAWARTPDGGESWRESIPTFDAPNP